MEKWLPSIITVIGSILGSGFIITLLQRRWARVDKREAVNVEASEGIISDGTKIREELWSKFGEQQGLINTLQAQHLDGISERYELRLAIKMLESKEEECRAHLAMLTKRLEVQERQ